AIVPTAPGRSSTANRQPSLSDSSVAIKRLTMSEGVPTEKGTKMRMTFAGKVSAATASAAQDNISAVNISTKLRFTVASSENREVYSINATCAGQPSARIGFLFVAQHGSAFDPCRTNLLYCSDMSK